MKECYLYLTFIFSVYLLFINTSCSNNKSILLKDYSYPVWTIKTRQIGEGKVERKTGSATAFFVRIDSRLFLVSAEHVFCVPDSLTFLTLQIRLFNRDQDIYQLHNVDVSKAIKIKPAVPSLNYPDFSIVEVRIPTKYSVNSVEKYPLNK